jgi:tellurium resistance protein TerZ
MSINLNKEQKFNFNLEKTELITNVFMGIGWDATDEEEDVDLDASCVLLNADKEVIEVIDFGNLTSEDEAVEHLGDNLTGDGDGDDEVINVNLRNLSPDVDSLVFTITSFSGQSFEDIDNCIARLVNQSTGAEMCSYQLKDIGDFTAVIMCKLTRIKSGWEFKALGIPTDGESADDLIDEIEAL